MGVVVSGLGELDGRWRAFSLEPDGCLLLEDEQGRRQAASLPDLDDKRLERLLIVVAPGGQQPYGSPFAAIGEPWPKILIEPLSLTFGRTNLGEILLMGPDGFHHDVAYTAERGWSHLSSKEPVSGRFGLVVPPRQRHRLSPLGQ